MAEFSYATDSEGLNTKGNPVSIEKRVERLERELCRAHRRNHLLLAGVALCFAIGAPIWILRPETLLAQNPANALKEVRANRFVLEDDKGKTRAELSMYKGGPRLELLDENGTIRTVLSSLTDGPGFALLNEKGDPRVMLTSLKDGPSLMLVDEKGSTRAKLNLLKDDPSFLLCDEKGDTGIMLNSTKNGSLLLFNEKGNSRVMLSSFKEGPSLDLSDEKGIPRVAVAVSPDGVPSLKLFDEKTNTRVMLGLGQGGSTLSLFDEKKTARVALMQGNELACMIVADEKGKSRTTLGATKTRASNGRVTTFPESTLLLYGPDGKVRWQTP